MLAVVTQRVFVLARARNDGVHIMPKTHNIKGAVYNVLCDYRSLTMAELSNRVREFIGDGLISNSTVYMAVYAMRLNGDVVYVRGASPRRVMLAEKRNAKARVIKLLRQYPLTYFTQVDIARQLDLDERRISRYLRDAVVAGTIRVSHFDGRKQYTILGNDNAKPYCPKCKSHSVHKHGKRNGYTRMLCQSCSHSFKREMQHGANQS